MRAHVALLNLYEFDTDLVLNNRYTQMQGGAHLVSRYSNPRHRCLANSCLHSQPTIELNQMMTSSTN